MAYSLFSMSFTYSSSHSPFFERTHVFRLYNVTNFLLWYAGALSSIITGHRGLLFFKELGGILSVQSCLIEFNSIAATLNTSTYIIGGKITRAIISAHVDFMWAIFWLIPVSIHTPADSGTDDPTQSYRSAEKDRYDWTIGRNWYIDSIAECEPLPITPIIWMTLCIVSSERIYKAFQTMHGIRFTKLD